MAKPTIYSPSLPDLAQLAQLEGDLIFLSAAMWADQGVGGREAERTACSANHPHFLSGTVGL
jgi:hypothetical protein